MSEFNPGDLVVCVDAHPRDPSDPETGLVEGRAYRVIGAVNLGGVLVAEADPSPWEDWCADRFRKIDAPQSEIADRIKACQPVRQREPA